MATNEVTCPICSADVPLAGDEPAGEEIYCGVCGAVLKLTGNAEDDDVDCEEDM